MEIVENVKILNSRVYRLSNHLFTFHNSNELSNEGLSLACPILQVLIDADFTPILSMFMKQLYQHKSVT